MAIATIISYPTNAINESITLAATLNSYELIQYLWVDISEADPTDTHIEIVYNGETITLYIQDECRYTPIDILFFNKEGAEQIITFFKKRVDSMSVTDSTFESDRGQPIEGYHQTIRYNVNAKSKFTLSSGFVEESNNEMFKQLLLSSKVWIYEGGTFTPVKVASSSIEYQTRQNDRLLNYDINFEFAFNEINNI